MSAEREVTGRHLGGRAVTDRLAMTPRDRLDYIEAHRRDPIIDNPAGLDQTCLDCRRREAAHWYCSGCYLPMGPSDWRKPVADEHRREILQWARESRSRLSRSAPRRRAA